MAKKDKAKAKAKAKDKGKGKGKDKGKGKGKGKSSKEGKSSRGDASEIGSMAESNYDVEYTDAKAERLYHKACEFEADGDLKNAQRTMEDCVARNRDYAKYFQKLGNLRMQRGLAAGGKSSDKGYALLKAAYKDLRKAVELNPTFSALGDHALLHMHLNALKRAAVFYELAIDEALAHNIEADANTYEILGDGLRRARYKLQYDVSMPEEESNADGDTGKGKGKDKNKNKSKNKSKSKSKGKSKSKSKSKSKDSSSS